MRTLRPGSHAAILVRLAIVTLTIATGVIHLTLGGPLFTLNGAGYLVAAGAMVVPIPLARRLRWLIRLGLVGYALAAIVGWYLMGPRYDVAYVAKAIEVALIALLLLEIRSFDSDPVRRARRTVAALVRAG
ncbi:MAG TPA: hypothetical protein VHL56_05225 [Candidatus Limnocylindrales bacterium]|nr:hypothetical protein [Candidatus Limnocylindrales bacterium]